MRLAPGFVLALTACGADPVAPSLDASLDASLDVSPELASPDAATDVGRVTGPARVAITRYEYAVDLESRALVATLRLRVIEAGDCLTLDFTHGAATEVTIDGRPAREPSPGPDTLRVCHPAAGFLRGETPVLSLRATIPNTAWRPTQVGFSQRNNVAGRRFTYLLSWVGQCGRIGPCDASPAAFATYRFTVTHPAGTQVLCPGEITPGETETVCAFEHPGGPTYSTLGIMALNGGWRRTPLGTVGAVALEAYDAPASRLAESLDRPRAQGFMRFMTERFGAYPYGDRLRIVGAPTYWSGFEHPGNLTLAETLVGGADLDHVLRHEIAHQWAGDQTTLAAVKDFVWKEAMAEYLAYVFEDENGLRDRARATLAQWRVAAERAERYPVPDEELPLTGYYGSAYGPGPMIFFRQLEVMHSRRQVLAALQALLGRPRAISVDDVRAALEAALGVPLEGYFRAWLHGTGAPAWPAVEATWTAAPDGAVTLVTTVRSRDGRPRPCRFTLRLTGEKDRVFDVPITVGDDGRVNSPVTVRPGFTVTGLQTNPEHEALVWPMTMPSGARWIEHRPVGGYDPFRAPEGVTTPGR